MLNITIIGGGFSGVILSIQLLLKNKDVPLKIRLIEKRSRIGQGVAYSTDKTFHLLNVRADKMSAFPDDPDHFVNWLKENDIPQTPTGHMPRKVYGEYLRDLLKNTIQSYASKHSTFEIIRDEASDIEYLHGHARISLKKGQAFDSDKVVLALGNFPPGPLSFIKEDLLSDKRYCCDPWVCDFIPRIKKEDNILIVGTGLTMIDTCITLAGIEHKGKILSISNHGYLPVAQNYSTPYPSFYEELRDKTSILDIFKTVKRHIHSGIQSGYDWRSVVDSLRPHCQQLWVQLNKSEKLFFLKHLNRVWNVARHRIPPEYSEILHSLIASDQLKIMPGKIISLKNKGEFINVEYRKRKDNKRQNFKVDFVINCTGPQTNYTKIEHPLIKNLLTKGFIKPGPLNLGIDVTPNGRVISEFHSDLIYTLGPPMVGVLFETTGVPEIREQASNLATKLIYDLKKVTEKVS